MAEYKTYPIYKDSKIQWLGEVPEHWKVLNGQFIFRVINERSKTGNELLLSVSEKKGVTPRSEANVTMFMAESYKGYKLCKKGDLVINSLWAWSNGLGFSEYHGIVSTAYSVYRPDHEMYDYKFLNYLLKTQLYVGQYQIVSKGIWVSRLQLSDWSFLRIPIAFPQKSEQTAISNFLESKIREIAGFVEFKEKTISLLKERKTAIINKAVTKGLEDTVPMKDSGYEWIGEIPEHWEVKRLRYLGKCQNGVSNGADYFGSGYPFVNYGDAYKNRVLPDDVSGLAKATKRDRELYSVKRGDVFFTRTSETIEEIGFASTCVKTIDDASFSGFLIRFRPMKNCLDTSFSKYYFRSNLHRPYFTKEMNLVIRASLSQDLLKGLPVILPSLSEQKLIGNYLDQQIAKLDLSIAQAETEISLIKEYQQNLISEAVTGKIDVREMN